MRCAILAGAVTAAVSSPVAMAETSRQPTATECERVAADIPSGAEVYQASKAELPDGRCYVRVTFFGNRELRRFTAGRISAGQAPDRVSLATDDGEVAVQLRLANATAVYPAFLDESGAVVRDDQLVEECERVRSELAAAVASVAGIRPTLSTQQGLEGGFWGDRSNDHCYVDVLFDGAAELAGFVDWRIDTLGADVERVTFFRPFGNTPNGPQIQVPLFLRTR